jgi:EpsI family protein
LLNEMKINRLQVAIASIVILAVAGLGVLLRPNELMARSSIAPNLEAVIPQKFAGWTLVPDISPVKPVDEEQFYQPDALSKKVYAQEVGRGYTDGRGNIVMLLVAYGPVQNYRLRAHRPEICYTAAGFRVSAKTKAAISYRDGIAPINAVRLITQRESRFEPVSYWMRVGDDISNGAVEHQLSRLKYGLKGVIPDGALIRVSTIGLSTEESFKLQDQFIRDLLAAIPQQDLKFFTGV